MNNKEKLLKIVSKKPSDTIDKFKLNRKNRAVLRESQRIAVKVLLRLKELNWKQTDLARKMNVAPQQITKIVSGKENLTIETQIKLQDILNIPILASYYEKETNAEKRNVYSYSEVIKNVSIGEPHKEYENTHAITMTLKRTFKEPEYQKEAI